MKAHSQNIRMNFFKVIIPVTVIIILSMANMALAENENDKTAAPEYHIEKDRPFYSMQIIKNETPLIKSEPYFCPQKGINYKILEMNTHSTGCFKMLEMPVNSQITGTLPVFDKPAAPKSFRFYHLLKAQTKSLVILSSPE